MFPADSLIGARPGANSLHAACIEKAQLNQRPDFDSRATPGYPPPPRADPGERPVKAVLDPYNPAGSTVHIRFDTSKKALWQTDRRHCHVNWVVCDSDRRQSSAAPSRLTNVRAYVKNQGFGFEVPHLLGATPKKDLPDFIVRVDDCHGNDDLLNLVVEIKGYRGEDAKDKANAMDVY